MAHILIDVGHPGHVHLFRNAARRWQEQGHDVLFTALDREMILYLLDVYRLPYRITYRRRRGKLALLLELLGRTWNTYRIARRFRPDLFVSFGNPTVGVPAWLLGRPYLALTDTEFAPEQHALFKPFATVIATPTAFQGSLGPRQIRYAGYHELAYLHPDEFTPDASALETVGLTPEDRFFLVRFVAWGSSHDVGQHGFRPEEKRQIVQELAGHGRVLLSAEGDIDPELKPLITHFPPENIHHLLAFATLYVGEGGTTLTEAALLGTPAIFVSSLRAGNWYDLSEHYHLMFLYHDGREALDKVRELLTVPDLKKAWAERRAQMLAEKIDPTPWLVELGDRLLTQPGIFPADLAADT